MVLCRRAAQIWRRNCKFPARLGGGKRGSGLPPVLGMLCQELYVSF